MAQEAIQEVEIPGLSLWRRGKVRDIFSLDGKLLIVATDRLSAFDVVLPTPIPDKGKILTQMTLKWLGLTRPLVADHFVSDQVTDFLALPESQVTLLRDRSMVVTRAEVIPVECVVRGYLSGSAWGDYRRDGEVCGIRLPAGLRQSEALPEPLFTPATKAESGHDLNITFRQVEDLIGKETAAQIRDLALAVYSVASHYAQARDIIISDTKFEFGWIDGKMALVDEVLTPDSSRFWDARAYEPGRPQDSFDKQFVRDYLETLLWDKTPPGPELPPDIVHKTRARYQEAKERLFGTCGAGL